MAKLDWVNGLQNYLSGNPSYFREIPQEVLPYDYKSRRAKMYLALKHGWIEVMNTGGFNVYYLPGNEEPAKQKADTLAPFTHKLKTPFFWKGRKLSCFKREMMGDHIIRVHLSNCGGREFFEYVGTIFYRPGEEETAADLMLGFLEPDIFEDSRRCRSLSRALRQNLPQKLAATVVKKYPIKNYKL